MESSGVDRVNRRGRARRPLLLAVLAVCLVPIVRAADEPQRAFWMSHASLESADAVRRTIMSAVAGGFNTVLAPVSLAPELPSFDGMAETIKEAGARKLRVFAWLDVGRAAGADEIPGSREHVLYQHPEWLMVPRDLSLEMMRVDLRSPEYIGRLARWTRANADRAEGLYLSPIHPEAITYLSERVTNVLVRYRIHGVHLDALRFPGAEFDYSGRALELFRSDVRRGLDTAARVRMDRIEAIDPFAYPEEFPDQWRLFRQERLTALVTRLRAAIRAVQPDAIVSAGVALDADTALRDHLQDWRGWMEHRIIDAIARLDGTGNALVFSYENVLRPLAPILTTSQSSAAGGAP